jgi:flagellar biosynthesis anti-sigma factor FlgM
MKIEHSAVPPTPDRVDQAGGVTSGDGAGRTRPGGPPQDAVAVSPTAHLVAQAADAVGPVGSQHDVRPDVVARAKAALANGDVGADLERLADRMIDGLLDE